MKCDIFPINYFFAPLPPWIVNKASFYSCCVPSPNSLQLHQFCNLRITLFFHSLHSMKMNHSFLSVLFFYGFPQKLFLVIACFQYRHLNSRLWICGVSQKLPVTKSPTNSFLFPHSCPLGPPELWLWPSSVKTSFSKYQITFWSFHI